MADDLGAWAPLTVAALATEFGAAVEPWWIIGGEALDLFVGRSTRAHVDIDAEVLRRDTQAWRAHLTGRGWELHIAHEGRLRLWTDDVDLTEAHGLNGVWARRGPSAPWAFDVKLASASGDDWVFRRDPRVRRPMAAMARRDPDGVPYVVPEVQLLLKAKDPRPKDEADFALVAPMLDDAARTWLARAIATAHPGHPWIAVLDDLSPPVAAS